MQSAHVRWLDAEANRLLSFGRASPAPAGGARWLDGVGHPDESQPIHTWISARMTHVFAVAHLMGVPGAAAQADQCLAGLSGFLSDPTYGGWFRSAGPNPSLGAEGKDCYDHAFVVLAAASATLASRPGASELLTEALEVLDERFWDARHGMFVSTWDSSWTKLDAYRGLNANMHCVEALLAATDATGDPRWRERAGAVAARVVEWAAAHRWRIPEHFDEQWQPLLDHNRDRPDDPFEPFGATIGHGLEWSRLLLHVHAASNVATPDLVSAAERLFARAVADGWSSDGAPGFVYTCDWNGRPVVRDRMHWVVAEAIAAAAALLTATGKNEYDEWYRQWWDYAADYLIDHEGGSWRHQLDAANNPVSTVWKGKPDLYHAFQATLIPRLPLAPSLAAAVAGGYLR